MIAFSGAFHGRTIMGMALTGKVAPYKLSFGPMPGDVYHVPFPNGTQDITVADSLKALDLLFKVDIDPKRVAAIIIEPVQGEGGFNITPPELMTALRKVCDEHGILLIADEVQTGFGRTGKLYAMEHHSVQADLITMAKSLGGGMPISGVVGRADVMDAPPPAAWAAPRRQPAGRGRRARGAGRHRGRKLCERAVQLGDKLRAHLEGLRASPASPTCAAWARWWRWN